MYKSLYNYAYYIYYTNLYIDNKIFILYLSLDKIGKIAFIYNVNDQLMSSTKYTYRN